METSDNPDINTAQSESYESYPLSIILISNFVTLSIYTIGAYILSRTAPVWLALYLLYIVALEIRLMKFSCVNCYYYGKLCAFGKGKVASWFFNQDDPGKFNQDKITFKHILPDFLVSVIPLVVGIALLIMNFAWLILLLIILLIALTSAGNAFVRGSLACKHCKQRILGCPAEQLFNKNKK